jgi:hypothetical protein
MSNRNLLNFGQSYPTLPTNTRPTSTGLSNPNYNPQSGYNQGYPSSYQSSQIPSHVPSAPQIRTHQHQPQARTYTAEELSNLPLEEQIRIAEEASKQTHQVEKQYSSANKYNTNSNWEQKLNDRAFQLEQKEAELLTRESKLDEHYGNKHAQLDAILINKESQMKAALRRKELHMDESFRNRHAQLESDYRQKDTRFLEREQYFKQMDAHVEKQFKTLFEKEKQLKKAVENSAKWEEWSHLLETVQSDVKERKTSNQDTSENPTNTTGDQDESGLELEND